MANFILKGNLLVPKKYVTKKHREKFTYVIDMEKNSVFNYKPVCGICVFFKQCQGNMPNLEFKSKICEDFGAQEPNKLNKLELRFWKETKNHYSFHRGNLNKILKHFGDLPITLVDKRTVSSIEKYGLEFHDLPTLKKIIPQFDKKKFRDQQRVARIWIKKGYGQIKCPARYGKTVLLSYIVSELQQRTLILAHQKDLLRQFQDTFSKFTNVDEITRQQHKRMMGIWDKSKQFYPLITFASWQSFNSVAGKKILKKAKNLFGVIFVDESHCSGSPAFSKIVNEFNSMYRGGCTATEKRVDKLHISVNHILGPVVAKGVTRELKCSVHFVHTGVKCSQKQRVFRISFLTKNNERTQLIIRNVKKDLREGRYVMVVVERMGKPLDHFEKIAKPLRKEGYRVGLYNGQTIDRGKFLEDAKAHKFDVIICQRAMVKVGINIPACDTIHVAIPISNPYTCYQEVSRIRTPFKGKKPPKIVDYVDEGTALNSFYSRKKVYREQGFDIVEGNMISAESKVKPGLWGGR